MMDGSQAIIVRNLTKSFKVRTEEKKLFLNKRIDKVILDDISFDVPKGQVLGIVGKNGSGKSTLLKIISRIMKPNAGKILVRGRIASILELGMGFHPDMSGKENILLKGQMYGLKKKEMLDRLDSIIDYTGIRPFINNPVRTYSSGMLGRLAFAVMINVEADIMLVDEVLSVGDMEFATKALEHFNRLSKSGKTIIIVSHDLDTIKKMCDRVIWIDKGHIVMDDEPEVVLKMYRGAINNTPGIMEQLADADIPEAQYALACAYRDGVDREVDHSKYVYWLKRAADNSHYEAMAMVAEEMYFSEDPSEREGAIKYYQPLANAGDMHSRLRISQIMGDELNGEDVTVLVSHSEEAAKSGHPYLQFQHAELLSTIAYTAKQNREAISWYEKAVEGGNIGAMYRLYEIYEKGNGTKVDPAKAHDYLVMAAENGSLAAVDKLISRYYKEQDWSETLRWVRYATELGDVKETYLAAHMTHYGYGEEADIEKSRTYYKAYALSAYHTYKKSILAYYTGKGAEQEYCGSIRSEIAYLNDYSFVSDIFERHDPDALNADEFTRTVSGMAKADSPYRTVAARIYFEGFIVPQDYTKAMELFQQAYAQGDSEAAGYLARIFNEGLGTDIDESKGRLYSEYASMNLPYYNL